MARPMTRSQRAKSTAFAVAPQPQHLSSPPTTPGPNRKANVRRAQSPNTIRVSNRLSSAVNTPLTPNSSRKHTKPETRPNRDNPSELPPKQRVRHTRESPFEAVVSTNTRVSVKASRKPKPDTFGIALGETSFPDWEKPTTKECYEVHRLLTARHGEMKAPTKIPEPSLVITGCGQVPSVLDALIRTCLSSNTSARNSALALEGLVNKFGVLEEGVGKGSVNWDAVRLAPIVDIFEAIKRGGQGNIKSKSMKKLLDMVYEENQERRKAHLSSLEESACSTNELSEANSTEITKADQHVLSLDYLHLLPDKELLEHLVRYPGVAAKTAKCVAMFCMGRSVFAADTHILRITRWLGWYPPTAGPIKAQAHLEARIPNELKYSLHRLFIEHGRTCPRCIARRNSESKGWDDGCEIDHLVERIGKYKSDSEITGAHKTSQNRSIPRTTKAKKRKRDYDESESSDADTDILDDDYDD